MMMRCARAPPGCCSLQASPFSPASEQLTQARGRGEDAQTTTKDTVQDTKYEFVHNFVAS